MIFYIVAFFFLSSLSIGICYQFWHITKNKKLKAACILLFFIIVVCSLYILSTLFYALMNGKLASNLSIVFLTLAFCVIALIAVILLPAYLYRIRYGMMINKRKRLLKTLITYVAIIASFSLIEAIAFIPDLMIHNYQNKKEYETQDIQKKEIEFNTNKQNYGAVLD